MDQLCVVLMATFTPPRGITAASAAARPHAPRSFTEVMSTVAIAVTTGCRRTNVMRSYGKGYFAPLHNECPRTRAWRLSAEITLDDGNVAATLPSGLPLRSREHWKNSLMRRGFTTAGGASAAMDTRRWRRASRNAAASVVTLGSDSGTLGMCVEGPRSNPFVQRHADLRDPRSTSAGLQLGTRRTKRRNGDLREETAVLHLPAEQGSTTERATGLEPATSSLGSITPRYSRDSCTFCRYLVS